MDTEPAVDKMKNSFSRKDEIFKQATILFKKRGYTATSVRDLAQESGIEAPSIYSHFKSKEDILQQICFGMAKAFMTGLSKAEKKKSPDDKLKAAIKAHIKVVTANSDASAVMWNEWKNLTEPYFDDFKTMIHGYETRFRKIIKKGIKAGIFKKNDPALTTTLLLSSLNGLAFRLHPGKRQVKELNSTITNIFFKGMVKRKN